VRAARIISALLLTVFLMTKAEAVDLIWSPVIAAIDGSSIPSNVVSYRVFYSTDDSNYTFAASTAQNNMSLDSITTGCYFFHVTALREDSNQESVPSNSLEYCAGDVVQPSPGTLTADPEAPTGVNIVE
jgi:hypothetical protein